MGDGIFSKIKGIKEWITEEEIDETYVDEEEEEDIEETDEFDNQYASIGSSKTAKIVNLHTSSQMKVVIVEPKKYDEVTTIADHLKQKRAVIVNLEGLNDQATRNSIFQFMNGAVYVLDGDIQKVSKAIFILAPNNVNIDATIKKELESKTLFPWQNK
ncbi:cell division protein SepF [Romboutsia sp.]|uniref:cell division protein SepF n=1 Tax=Romboutsia sp. TaxID=1965302 RepID=UPI003F3330D3